MEDYSHQRPQTRHETERLEANSCDGTCNSTDDGESDFSFVFAGGCNDVRTAAKGNEKAGEEDRTPDIQLGKLTFYR